MELIKHEEFERIYFVDTFEKEFKKVTKEGIPLFKNRGRYQNWLRTKLIQLDIYGLEVLECESFEQLVMDSTPKLFVIRSPKSESNLRVIFGVKSDMIVILTVFKEKSKKDYRQQIVKAKKMLTNCK